MHPPTFWRHDGWLARALSPASGLVAAATARRVARPGWRAPVPVLCCGNVTVGGAGKTTLALDIGQRLQRRGLRVAFITRGYGGTVRGAVQVHDGASATQVGDEALLLAAVAPTWVCADRAAAAAAAVADGAAVLVMDDGLQNAGLIQDVGLLVIDGAVGFGNGRVMPAGPLREPVAAGAARCHAAILVGADVTNAASALPATLPVIHATLRTVVTSGAGGADGLAGRRVFAFAGIGRPGKFYETLALAGAVIAGRQDFADHYVYRTADLVRLQRRAREADADLVTTPKDAVRLPAGFGVIVAGVALHWAEEAEIEALLDNLV